MPESSPESGDLPRSAHFFWPMAGAIGLLALLSFAYDLGSERHFVDESAYFSQAYFADLYRPGKFNDRGWVELPAYDLPPLPKYFIGWTLRAAGYSYPGQNRWQAWYEDTSRRFDRPGALAVARIPSAILGAIGCVAAFALGTQAFDNRAGFLGALFLIANPLYRTHARRAMSDVPTEAFVLLCLAVTLWAWRRTLIGKCGPLTWLASGLAGTFASLAILCKLSGMSATLVVGAWIALAWALKSVHVRRKLLVAGEAVVAGAVAIAVFFLLNPYLTAQPKQLVAPDPERVVLKNPWQRAVYLVRFRIDYSHGQQLSFRHNALDSPLEKIKSVAVQGFGRFGPLGTREDDSTIRYSWEQDKGALVWGLLVAAGWAVALVRGWKQLQSNRPPTAWALLAQALVTYVVVTAYIPLAWDRYYLPLQAVSALLAAGAVFAAFDAIVRRRKSILERT